VTEESNSNQVTIDMSDYPKSNGGCSLLTYNVQIDDGLGSSFVSLIGEKTPYMALKYTATGLVKGRSYRIRYRTKNCQGWS
jgi:hypothetical protein